MERIISELKNTANKVAKKSGELVEISKVKLSIAGTKSEISTQFKALGEAVYLAQKEGNDTEAKKIEEIISVLDGLYDRLEKLSEVNSALRNETICPFCGKSNPINQTFCGKCGNKLFSEDNEAYEGEVVEDIPEVETI